MRHLMHIRPTFERATQIDAKGGPGTFFQYIAERFKPEAMYVNTLRREGWMVVDFESPAKMREFAQSCFMAMGSEPDFLATVVTGQEAAQIIPEAVRNAKNTPVL